MYKENICIFPSFTNVKGNTFVIVKVSPEIEQLGVGVLTLEGQEA